MEYSLCQTDKRSSDTLNKIMSALEKKITSNEDRISSTKRPRSDKCPSPSKRLPLTSSRVLHSRVLILRGLYQCVLHDSSVHRC